MVDGVVVAGVVVAGVVAGVVVAGVVAGVVAAGVDDEPGVTLTLSKVAVPARRRCARR